MSVATFHLTWNRLSEVYGLCGTGKLLIKQASPTNHMLPKEHSKSSEINSTVAPYAALPTMQ